MAEAPTAVSARTVPAPRRPSSLAYTDQTEPTKPPLTCPYGSGRVVVELYSGSVYPDRCRSNGCLYCLPLNARRRCLAVTLAEPRRMIRLSWVADSGSEVPSATALQRIKLIRRNLLRMGFAPGEWCFTIEKNPRGTGYHAHCLQTGPSIPQADLQIACERAHAGQPFINAIRRTGKWTSQYGMKGFGADGYGMKTFRPNGDMKEALKMNGGRVEHHSRAFYAIDGVTYSVREMERMAIAQMNDGKEIAFIGCHPNQVDKILSNGRLRGHLIEDALRRSAIKAQGTA